MRRWLVVLSALGVGLASSVAEPAGAHLYTIDYNNNGLNDLDGTDDLTIAFTGSSGPVSGVIRAVDLDVTNSALQAQIAPGSYHDFTGSTPVDFDTMDVFIFDVVLLAGSALIDQIGVAVTTVPAPMNPIGAGWFTGCDPGVPAGCRANVPGGGEIPVDSTATPTPGDEDIEPSPGIPGTFPGAALFGYDHNGSSGGNLTAGETTRRLFLTYPDSGFTSPLNNSQTALFMISSGTNDDMSVDIVPEPGTGALLAMGVTLLAWSRSRPRSS